ncbi:MAG: hypothetical protein JKY18_05555 [Flavobacteriales bacterium]|nr:hypothetical protein [Flavobacteriales bacterium]
MEYSNYIVIGLILAGAAIMARSVFLTRKIFDLLPSKEFRNSWRNLSIFMIFFFFGYLGAAFVVIIGQGGLLELLTGVVFFFGALFVYIVVRTGLATFKELQAANLGLERRVKLRTQELESKNRELEQFAYIASHDLQEPLRTVISFVDLLKNNYQDKLDENADKYLEFIKRASTRMRALIKGLLDFSRIGQDRELTAIDCNTLIVDIKSDLTSIITESNTVFDIGELPQLKGYATELRLLFQNLITNAIKFHKTDTAPHVKISAQKEDGHWKFAVEDDGIGIAENQREKIFVIFQRLHGQDQYDGTGIGLAHCQKIVDLHGGKIWVDSQPNKGSTFYFTIPY